MGFRFRLHDKTLPGCPDIVLKRWKTVVLVNGCFWHRHKNCRYTYVPKTRIAFWNKKFAGNMKRDAENVEALKRLGWRVNIVWECELRNMAGLKSRLHKLRL